MNHANAARVVPTLVPPVDAEDTGFRLRTAVGSAPANAPPKRPGKRPRRRDSAMARLEDPRVAAVGRFVRESFEKRPVAATAVAIGLGFLIGGGLSTRIGRAALMSVARYALRELVSGSRRLT